MMRHIFASIAITLALLLAALLPIPAAAHSPAPKAAPSPGSLCAGGTPGDGGAYVPAEAPTLCVRSTFTDDISVEIEACGAPQELKVHPTWRTDPPELAVVAQISHHPDWNIALTPEQPCQHLKFEVPNPRKGVVPDVSTTAYGWPQQHLPLTPAVPMKPPTTLLDPGASPCGDGGPGMGSVGYEPALAPGLCARTLLLGGVYAVLTVCAQSPPETLRVHPIWDTWPGLAPLGGIRELGHWDVALTEHQRCATVEVRGRWFGDIVPDVSRLPLEPHIPGRRHIMPLL